MSFVGETAWVTQAQMAELVGTTQHNVSPHLQNAYDGGEFDCEATWKDFFQVRRERSRDVARSILHYDVDAVISVGYRVHVPRGVQVRRWATGFLRGRLPGFITDD